MVEIVDVKHNLNAKQLKKVSSKELQDITFLQSFDSEEIVLNASFYDVFHEISEEVKLYLNQHFSRIYIQSKAPIAVIHKLTLLLHGGKRSMFEEEWARYKYKILEFSVKHYQQVRTFLKEQIAIDAKDFYQIIEEGLTQRQNRFFENAALHVFGYFKKDLTSLEKESFLIQLKEAKTNQQKDALRNVLFNYVKKFNKQYLKESYFFLSNIG